MPVLDVQFEKTERGYNVSIDGEAVTFYESREATWEAIYAATKDIGLQLLQCSLIACLCPVWIDWLYW